MRCHTGPRVAHGAPQEPPAPSLTAQWRRSLPARVPPMDSVDGPGDAVTIDYCRRFRTDHSGAMIRFAELDARNSGQGGKEMMRTRLALLIVADVATLTFGQILADQDVRHVPERDIPVPATVSPATQAVIARPLSPIWNEHPKSAEEWKVLIARLADAVVTTFPELRQRLGVNVEPTVIGGVKAYIVTPESIPRDQPQSTTRSRPRRRLCTRPRRGGYQGGHLDGRLQRDEGHLGRLSHATRLSLSSRIG
jgi:hypothetical protein